MTIKGAVKGDDEKEKPRGHREQWAKNFLPEKNQAPVKEPAHSQGRM